MEPITLVLILTLGGWGCVCYIAGAIHYIDKFLKREATRRAQERVAESQQYYVRRKYYRHEANIILDDYMSSDTKNIVMEYYDSIIKGYCINPHYPLPTKV